MRHEWAEATNLLQLCAAVMCHVQFSVIMLACNNTTVVMQ